MYCLRNKLLLFAVLLPGVARAALSEEELFFKGVADVNNGDLHFISTAPASPVHHHQNQITLSRDSLQTGWAALEQCHYHLDPVPDMQIVYGQDRIRNLTILRSQNIGRSWVHQNSVQMERVERNAVICISAETRALASDGAGHFVLSSGPYMRRFLDGYYPMRVSLKVITSGSQLQFVDVQPAPQVGFNVTLGPQEVSIEALFEGELRTRIRFSSMHD